MKTTFNLVLKILKNDINILSADCHPKGLFGILFITVNHSMKTLETFNAADQFSMVKKSF